MDDLTKSVATNSKPLNQAKQDKWLNKDRLWNFVFWFGISGGLSLASFVKFVLKMPDLFLVIAWSVLLGIPLIVTLANKTRFIKKDTFANSEDIELTKKQMPTGNFIWLTILCVALTFALSDKYAGRHVISSFVTFAGLFSGFSLYFIFKNCPISILFNYKFWVWKSRQSASCPNVRVGSSSNHFRNHSSSSSRSSSSDYFTNPSYSSSMSNIYYESHRRR